jgi:anti-sigma factor RsiW
MQKKNPVTPMLGTGGKWRTMIDCSSVQRLRHAYLDGELTAKEGVEIQTHLEGCGECAVLYRNEKLFLDLLKTSLMSTTAPVGLHQKVQAILRSSASTIVSDPRRPTRSRSVLVPMLSVTVVLFIVAILHVRSDSLPDLVNLALQTHQGYLKGQAPLDVRSSDPVRVVQWFEKRIGFPISLAQEPVKNFRLRGGRLIEFQGRKAAFLAYDMGQHRLSLVMTVSQGADFFDGQHFTFKQTRFYQSQHHGFHTLSWTQEGIAYVFVSEKQELNKQACLICHGDSKQQQAIHGFAGKSL